MNPRVGVGVLVLDKRGHIVMGLRKGSHGAGTWALPGGHLEFGESFETCAAREVHEETGLLVENVRYLTATNDIMDAESKHYVTVFMTCTVFGELKQPEVLEPEKCELWRWVGWEELRAWANAGECASGKSADGGQRLFLPLLNLFRQRPTVDPIKNLE